MNYILDQATDKGASWVDDDPPTQAYLDKLERLLQLLQVKGVDLKTGTLFVELFHQWEAGVFSYGNMNGQRSSSPPLPHPPPPAAQFWFCPWFCWTVMVATPDYVELSKEFAYLQLGREALRKKLHNEVRMLVLTGSR